MKHITIQGLRLEYRDYPATAANRPTLMLLHEGLGSVGMWRHFPEKLAAHTACRVIVWSRAGYGGSEPYPEARTERYMHREGEEMLPAAIAIFMVFSLVHFTIGIRILAPQASLRGILQGPMLWAMILGVMMSLAGLALPPWLATCTKMLGDTAIPLGLFALGVGFSSFRISNWSMGIVGAALCPLSSLLVTWLLLRFIPLAPKMQGLLLLYAALPPAVMNYIFAEQYKQDPGLVSAIVVCGSIASVIFVPFALYLAL